MTFASSNPLTPASQSSLHGPTGEGRSTPQLKSSLARHSGQSPNVAIVAFASANCSANWSFCASSNPFCASINPRHAVSAAFSALTPAISALVSWPFSHQAAPATLANTDPMIERIVQSRLRSDMRAARLRSPVIPRHAGRLGTTGGLFAKVRAAGRNAHRRANPSVVNAYV